ncbi:MAG: putative exosortase B-associated extracellular polysaccharide biosynthesis transporter EpsL [Rhizobacter sp.]
MFAPMIRHVGVLLLVTLTTSAHGFGDDAVKVNAGYSLLRDSNLFRFSGNTDSQALTGRSNSAESIGISTVGLALSKTYSLQKFDLSLNVVDYRYRHFDYLSFTASNYKADWLWSLTPRLRGLASSERTEVLNSFADFLGINQRNTRVNLTTRLDGEYELDGVWRLLGGVSRSSQTNEAPVVSGDDTRTTEVNGGARYVFSSGSAIGYVYSNAQGRYTKRAMSPLQDDRFRQQNHELRLNWLFSGKSKADLSAAYFERAHPNVPQRDFSGLVTRASLQWNWTEKTSLAADFNRELAAYQTNDSNYTQTHRISIGPIWKITPKVTMRMRHEFANLDYRGQPSNLPASQRTDETHDSLIAMDWRPVRSLLLSGSVQHSRRSSNQANLDFRSTQTKLTAQLSY